MYFFSFLVTIRGEKNLYIFKFKNLSIFKNGLILLFFDFEMISNIILSIFKVLPVSHDFLKLLLMIGCYRSFTEMLRLRKKSSFLRGKTTKLKKKLQISIK